MVLGSRMRRAAASASRAGSAEALRPDERPAPSAGEPPIEELLDVDREYRERAAAGTLPRIAPWRENPGHVAWLPVLHTARGNRHYTALFSNTPRAHRRGATHDWVVLDVREPARHAREFTVITARYGALEGRRIVAGRDEECLRFHRMREWKQAIGDAA